MINRLKNNTKIKVISLLSALVLWLYVMTVEDPTETRVFSDIPINITNVSVIDDRGLAINPKEDLFADISINANLSSLRIINSDNIYIHGRIEDPKEGKNTIYLQVNLPERVNKYDIKPHSIVVNLEKVISEEKNINLYVKGDPKVDIDTINTEKKVINVTGPESLVNEVANVMATVDVDKKDKDFSTKLKLVPVNKYGEEVKGITLDEDYVIAEIKLLKQKIVPIKLNILGDNTNSLNDKYTINPFEITIEGTKETLETISSISTQQIKVEDLKDSDYIEVPLEIPENIKILDGTENVKIELSRDITTELLIPKTSIEFKNNTSGMKISLDKVPENIKVTLTYNNKYMNINKDDINLYVDLSEKNLKENKYSLKYNTRLNIKTINIEPEEIEI